MTQVIWKYADALCMSHNVKAACAGTALSAILLLTGCESAGQRAAAELTELRAAEAANAAPATQVAEATEAPAELAFADPTAAPDPDLNLVPSTRLVNPQLAPLTIHSAPASSYTVLATFEAGQTVELTGKREVAEDGTWHEVDLFPLEYSGWVPDRALLVEGDPILELWREKEAEEVPVVVPSNAEDIYNATPGQ